jgi:hypothetical protein
LRIKKLSRPERLTWWGAVAPSIGGRAGKDNESTAPEMPHGALPPIAGWDTRSPTAMPSLRAAPALTSST